MTTKIDEKMKKEEKGFLFREKEVERPHVKGVEGALCPVCNKHIGANDILIWTFNQTGQKQSFTAYICKECDHFIGFTKA